MINNCPNNNCGNFNRLNLYGIGLGLLTGLVVGSVLSPRCNTNPNNPFMPPPPPPPPPFMPPPPPNRRYR